MAQHSEQTDTEQAARDAVAQRLADYITTTLAMAPSLTQKQRKHLASLLLNESVEPKPMRWEPDPYPGNPMSGYWVRPE